MTYADTNFFANLLVEMTHHREAEQLARDCDDALPVTWLHRLEVINALQQCVFLSRQGLQKLRLNSEQALIMEAYFFDELDASRRFARVEIDGDHVERVFHDLAHRHTAAHGFRTYDLLHVSAALVLGCDTFWSFDQKARRLAGLERLAVN